jgi:glucans biosynthesis protein
MPSVAGIAQLPIELSKGGSFTRDTLVSFAQELASRPFGPPREVGPKLTGIGYDQYHDIEYRPEARLWSGEERGFEIDFRHAGFIYKNPVQVFEVQDGLAKPITYHHSLFDFGPSEALRDDYNDAFSGVRIWAPLEGHAELQEFVVFQGASYFRSRGKAQIYGASARGIAIDTAEPNGEEFSVFRSFWIERPERGDTSITVHALLDSPRLTGAYTFEITPGNETLMNVSAEIFTREEINIIGIAPLTSMFLFGPLNQHRFDDFRNAVHDSDGLLMWRGNGEWLWRALDNPRHLQVSLFMDENPKGFGLMQRATNFNDFQDLQARYDKRPSLWVEPKEDWGEGSVELVEIPTAGEFHDNVVVFWRPKELIPAQARRRFSYFLRWGAPAGDSRLAQVSATRSGLTLHQKKRLFIIDFDSPANAEIDDSVRVHASASHGDIHNVVGRLNEMSGGYRVSLEFEPDWASVSELRVSLTRDDVIISEIWLFRWTESQ